MRICNVHRHGLVPYEEALALQKEEVSRLQRGKGHDALHFLQHPHVLTLGRNATGGAITADRRLLQARGVDVVETDRGGDVTYHGPGQIVGYPLLKLEAQRRDIRRYVFDLEEVLIRALSDFDIIAFRDAVNRGVWTRNGKIASLGIRISRWVTCHGFALNVSTDLSFFHLIDPCGLPGCRMASVESIKGEEVPLDEVTERIVVHFAEVFTRKAVWPGERKSYVTA